MTRPNTLIDLKGIASVLGSVKLQVPVHQRPFEWTEEVREMLDDIGEAFNRKEAEYFLGSLVIISASEGQRPKVLDGQQRLAVASLLLTAIGNEFEKRGESRRAQGVRDQYLFKFDISRGTEHPQLMLNQIDDPYFRSLLQKQAAEPGDGAQESHRRLWKARQSISDWLTGELNKAPNPIDWLAEFTKYLDESAYVIYFTVPDDANAFLIFETMNDRGLDLSIADLLKNYLLGRAGEDLQSVLNLWTTALASLSAYGGDKLFSVFARHFWSSKHGLTREKDLYRSIKSRVSSPANVMDFAKDLARDSYYYAAILSPEHELWSEASDIARERIRTLQLLGLEQYRPMLLSALSHLKQEEVEEVLRLLISWNVRLLVFGGLGGGVMESNYSELGRRIRSGDLRSVEEIAQNAKKFIPSDAMFRGSFASARVSKITLARYYLRVLERTAKGEPQPEFIPNTDPSELTLEHILPERGADENWPQFNEEDRKAYSGRLGNMVLLTQKRNTKLRSAPFDSKCEAYQQSSLLLTKKAAEYSEWSKESIEERQQYLADLAVTAWNIEA